VEHEDREAQGWASQAGGATHSSQKHVKLPDEPCPAAQLTMPPPLYPGRLPALPASPPGMSKASPSSMATSEGTLQGQARRLAGSCRLVAGTRLDVIATSPASGNELRRCHQSTSPAFCAETPPLVLTG
jgi:hypothetical protein